ncbi:MAG: hypothetical protein V7644_2618 [Actinomycetota bacterium]|jgi:hypothetical protein
MNAIRVGEGTSGDEAAKQQSLFREVNDRIDEIASSFGPPEEIAILCECADQTCIQPIRLTRPEYEALRRMPTHFAVLAGHDLPEVERVVEQNDRFWTVAKVGDGAVAAIKLDPRRRAR